MNGKDKKKICPISNGRPTMMFRHSFITSCNRIQEVIASEQRSKKKDALKIECSECPVKSAMDLDPLHFTPPKEIMFFTSEMCFKNMSSNILSVTDTV